MAPQIDQIIARGRQAFDRRDYAAALADFRDVLAERPEFADVRHLTGVCLSFVGQPEAALEEFDRALELNPGYIEAHLNKALTLNELGRFDEARAAFEAAWQAEQKSGGPFSSPVTALLANAHAEVGDLYMEAGDPRKAAEQYRSALEMRPRFADIRNKLGKALLEAGELEQAESELGTALQDNPNFVAARINLGLVKYRRGAKDEALRDWETALQAAPGNAQARAFLTMFGRSAATERPRPAD